MYPSVKSVTPKADYMLALTFSNGESGTLDMKPYFDFRIFNRLKDFSAFQKLTVAFDTIEWETEANLDPEFVYDKCTKGYKIMKAGLLASL